MARRKLLGDLAITQKGIEQNGRECGYLVRGDFNMQRPLIFIHGSPGNALDWKWFLKNPEDDCALCVISRPGYGLSGGEKPLLEKDAEIFGHILERLTTERGATIIGHSLGGGFAAALAARYPDRVERLILVGASLDPGLEKIHMVQRLFAAPPLSWLLTRSLRHCNQELIQYPDFLIKLKGELSSIRCPVDIIHTTDDRLVPRDNVDYIRHYFKNADICVHELEQGGHFLNLSSPELISEIITSGKQHQNVP